MRFHIWRKTRSITLSGRKRNGSRRVWLRLSLDRETGRFYVRRFNRPRLHRFILNRNRPKSDAHRRSFGYSSAIRNGRRVCHIIWLGPVCVLAIIDH